MSTEPQALPPTTIEALREELVRVRAELSEYVGHEPTVREEMHHLGDENILLRKAVALLMTEGMEKTTVDPWNDDLNSMIGRLDIEPVPGRHDRTRFTYTRGPALPLGRKSEKHASRADMRDANRLLRQRDYGMRTHVSKHIADALTSKDASRWKAARALATALDGADVNLDSDIEGKLWAAGYDPKTAFNGPGAATPNDDPWAPKPDITADVPAPVREVLAEDIAEMLLAPENQDVHRFARNLAFALKGAGADITDAIKARIYDLTLGRDPSEPPF